MQHDNGQWAAASDLFLWLEKTEKTKSDTQEQLFDHRVNSEAGLNDQYVKEVFKVYFGVWSAKNVNSTRKDWA